MGVFSQIFSSLDATITSSVLAGSGAMQAYGVQLLLVAIPIYITLACYAVLRGIAGEGFGHVLSRAAYASLLLAALQGELGGVTAMTVMDFPEQLAGLAGSTPPAQQADALMDSVGSALDGAINEAAPAPEGDLSLSTILMELNNWRATFWVYFFGIFPWLLAAIFGALATAMLLFLKFALACCALFGPLFIAAALFDWSRNWFFTWLSASIGYAISTVIMALVIGAVGAVMVPLVGDAVALGGGVEPGVIAAAMLAACAVILVGLVILLQAQGIANGMIGSGGGSASAIAGALIPSNYTVRSAVGGAASGFKALKGRFGGGGGSGGGGSGASLAGAASRAKSNVAVMRGQGSAGSAARSALKAAND